MLSSSHRFLSHPNGSNDDNTYRGKLHFVGCKGRAVHWLCVVKIITATTTQTECGGAQWARERTKLYWPPAYLFGHQHFSGLDRPFIKHHSTGAFMLLLLGKAKALSTIYIYTLSPNYSRPFFYLSAVDVAVEKITYVSCMLHLTTAERLCYFVNEFATRFICYSKLKHE